MTGRLFVVEAAPVAEPGLSSSVLGRIAELRAEIRLLELGHKVARPGLDDDGVDLVVDHRLAVQVKSSAGRVDSGSGWRWEFDFRTGRKDRLRSASNVERTRSRSHLDFLLLYARDVDVWWVVPASECGAARVRIVRGGRTDASWRDAWHLLEAA